MARRYYSSTAVETTLSGAISNSATSITVTALSGFPNTTPWTAILDADTASEELVEVTNVAGTTLTVTRGVDGTSAVSHNAGASFRHGVSARDFDEANDHVNDSTGVHGIGASSAVVGTTDAQTLTNKTISGANNTISAIAQSSVTNLTTDLGNKADVANPTITGVLSVPDGSATAPSITNTGDTNTGIFHPAADTVAVATNGAERLRVDASGNLGVGDQGVVAITNPLNNLSFSPRLEIAGTSAPTASSAVLRVDASASPGVSIFAKARGSAVTSPAVVSSGDTIGRINFQAHDGTAYSQAADITAGVDSAPSTGSVPGRLAFWTTTSGVNPTEKMRIDANGLITGTGTSLGAWTAYTPTLGGTGWAIGNGTLSGVYCQIGKTVMGRIRIVFGSTSTYGSATLTASLPITAINGDGPVLATGVSVDVSLSQSYSMNITGNSTALALRVLGTKGVGDALISTEPFTWATGDEVRISFSYQAA